MVNGVKKYYSKTELENAPETKVKADRLTLKIPVELCNSIVLSYDGCQHMKDAYYYKWNGLPYGNYRVVETQSFYDVNDNNIYDKGIDYDTSSEYYYMLYPPQRDSSGVCHIQNYTSNVRLNVSKQWFTNESGKDEISYDHLTGKDALFDPTIEFEIYRSTETGTPQKDADGEFFIKNAGDLSKVVNGNDGSYIFKTNEDGTPLTIESKDMATVDDTGAPYYYYLREITDNTVIGVNTNDDGFVKCGIADSYCVSYQDGDLRNITFKNAPEMVIELTKEWADISNPDKNDEIKFTLYQSIYDAGDNVKILSGDDYFYIVNSEGEEVKLETVGNFTTQKLTKKITSKDSEKIAAYRMVDNVPKKLYYYVVETDGGEAYKLSDYDVTVFPQGISWNMGESKKIKVSNKSILKTISFSKQDMSDLGHELPDAEMKITLVKPVTDLQIKVKPQRRKFTNYSQV